MSETNPYEATIHNSHVPHSVTNDLLECRRTRDPEIVAETKDILKQAGISYKVGSTSSNFDVAQMGAVVDPEVIISVRREDFKKARTAVENEFLNDELPADHYLHNFNDEDLIDLLGNESDWGPYDVAHARQLAKQRNIDPEAVEKKKEESKQLILHGKPAPSKLIFSGWVLILVGIILSLASFLGGIIIAPGIAASIAYMKIKTPEGKFFLYDDKSREYARFMMIAGIIACILATFMGAYLREY